MQLNNQWPTEESKEEMEKKIETGETKTWWFKTCGMQLKQFWEGNLQQNNLTLRKKINLK